ncbi:MAG: 6-phosphofructokinase [Gemmataceae bacterium]|nr:6-phosphofructokinase [Gemmataceae bacterium]
MANHKPIKRIGMLVGGGPAPGINGVISAVTYEALNLGIEVLGFQDGYRWLVEGPQVAQDHCRILQIPDVRYIHNRGGSILGTSRKNPEHSMDAVLAALRHFGVDALVSIGGDDTATSASRVFKHSGGSILVAHVPKTIDNDLPLPGNTPTFGFETARHIGVGIVQNLMVDAQTTSRWYLIVCMGRNAGHLALGTGKAAAATITVIPEEFEDKRIPLSHLLDVILGAIIKRRSEGRNYGIAVLAEGLIEKVDKDELTGIVKDSHGRYGNFKLDEFGHPRLGEIEFGKLIREHVVERMKPFPMLKTTFIDKDLGYEMRCADPIPFDVEYTRDLGYGAVKFLHTPQARESGAIINYLQGKLEPVALKLDPDKNHMETRIVDIHGERYECARKYMRRLEADDFDESDKLKKVADTVHLTPPAFRERFGYLVGRA